MRAWVRTTAALLVASGISSPALAGRATNTVDVSATVLAGCSLRTRPLMFVAPNGVLNVAVDATTTATVKCTPNTAFSVDIDDGLHFQGNNKRRMRNALGVYLPYNVYLDAARTRVWGKGQSKNYAGNSGAGAPIDLPIYGRVPISLLPATGNYRDTLVVTLNF